MKYGKLVDLYRHIEDEEMAINFPMQVQKNLAKIKPTYIPGVSIIKYNPATTMFKGNWNAYVVQAARGHLVKPGTMEPVNMPFPKLFEAQEVDAVIPDDTFVIAFNKRNGYMLDVTWSEEFDQLIIGTTGTIDSDYVKLGSKYIKDWMVEVFKAHAGYTFTFEVCDPSDPHIFPEPAGLYLIGIRRVDWGSSFNLLVYKEVIEQFRQEFRDFKSDVKFDEPHYTTYGQMVKFSKVCDCEGLVVWLTVEGDTRALPLKLKGSHYKIRKKLARSSPELLLKVIFDRKHDNLFADHPNYLKIREHFMDADVLGAFAELGEQERLFYLTKLIDNIRKEA